MSYKFKVTETFAKGLRRISAEQINQVGQCLAAEGDVHKGVHEARKTLKRLRALIALFRGAIDDHMRRDLDERLRDIARSLAGTREIQALLDSIGTLHERFGEAAAQPALARLSADLEAQLAAAEAARAKLPTPAALRDDLAAVADKMQDLSVSARDFEAIRDGLEHTYRKARHWHARAYGERSNELMPDETFHEWRKHLQRHWRQMQLVSAAWPADMKLRVQISHALAETIGKDHDLAVLDAHIARAGRQLGSPSQLKACRAMCRRLQEELRVGARLEGKRLFLEPPGAFSERLRRYWRLARREHVSKRAKGDVAVADRTARAG